MKGYNELCKIAKRLRRDEQIPSYMSEKYEQLYHELKYIDKNISKLDLVIKQYEPKQLEIEIQVYRELKALRKLTKDIVKE